jgi:glucose-6-phosphate dehydrogenase assembly protein OpcA
MTLLEEAAIEIESVADEFRGRCVIPGTVWWPADAEAERAEYDRLMDLARRLREADKP